MMGWWGPPPQSGHCPDCDVQWRDLEQPCWMCGKPGEARITIDPQYAM